MELIKSNIWVRIGIVLTVLLVIAVSVLPEEFWSTITLRAAYWVGVTLPLWLGLITAAVTWFISFDRKLAFALGFATFTLSLIAIIDGAVVDWIYDRASN